MDKAFVLPVQTNLLILANAYWFLAPRYAGLFRANQISGGKPFEKFK
jgi:hypothetical protein